MSLLLFLLCSILWGFRMRRYLDDWLVQSNSQESLLGDLQTVPHLCQELGDCGQPSEFRPGSLTGGSVSGGCHRLHLFPGFYVGGEHLPAAIDSHRVSVLRLAYRELMALAPRRPFFAGSPSSWRQTVVAVPPALPPSILGSSGSGRSSVCVAGVSSRPPVVDPSLCQVSPALHFWSAASDLGWGAHLDHQIASGLLDAHHAALSINARELLAVQLGLLQFQSSLQGRTVAVFCDNTTQWLLFARWVAHDPSPHHLGSGDLAMDGVPLHPPGFAVPPGLHQRPRGRPVSPSPAPTFNVVTTSDRFSIFEKSLAGPNRFICDL